MLDNTDVLAALKDRLKAVPVLTGVYLFKNLNGDVIYVGKARILRNRLRSYFQKPERLDPKVRAMMQKVHDFDYVVTSGELEALILECNLIKSYQPRYNIFFRDDKSYPYLKITLHEDYPRLVITREKTRDQSRYYGPYADVTALKDTVNLLQALFPVRSCKEMSKKRPCLNYDLKRCLGPCTGKVDQEEYQAMIQRIVDFLEGDTAGLVNRLNQEMREAADRQEYELAARLRDRLVAVKQMAEEQKVVSSTLVEADIIATAGNERDRLVVVMRIRGGKMIAKDSFRLQIGLRQTPEEILSFFIQQYYSDNPDIPREVLLEAVPSEHAVQEAWLSERRRASVHIRVPMRGEKKRILDMARDNAVLLWEERLRRDDTRRETLVDLARTLKLEVVPERMECYDVSHLGGEETVASMVVFTGGVKDPSAYRRFKLNEQNNDYQALEEALRRRLTAGIRGEAAFLPLPDLMIIDGGLGQLNVAVRVLQELDLDIPVISLAKKNEEIYLPGEDQPLRLPHASEMLKLLQRIRDEAHRFAITLNRKRIRKRSLASILDHIPGIGERRRQALQKHFGSLENIKKASIEELAAVPTMNTRAASAVYDFFHHQ